MTDDQIARYATAQAFTEVALKRFDAVEAARVRARARMSVEQRVAEAHKAAQEAAAKLRATLAEMPKEESKKIKDALLNAIRETARTAPPYIGKLVEFLQLARSKGMAAATKWAEVNAPWIADGLKDAQKKLHETAH